jgi:zeaxanthin glucosyltransferase
MSHFAITSPATTGPLNTMLPLGQELQRRGHRVTVFGLEDMQREVEVAGLGFQPMGRNRFPVGSVKNSLDELGDSSSLTAVRMTVQHLKNWAEVVLNEGPALLRQHSVKALIANQGAVESGTLADACNIPFVTICSAVPLNQESRVPPVFTSWEYNPHFLCRVRNAVAYFVQSQLAQPVIKLVVDYRFQHGLRTYAQTNDIFSPLAQISQFPKSYEFPRKNLPAWFHFTGPFHTPLSRATVDFPWAKVSGQRPIIYASMGTLQNRQKSLFVKIAEACLDLDVDLILSLGGSQIPLDTFKFHSHVIAVRYAPQLEILKRASLMVTHGGANSVMECLMNAVPMVVIPITNDQPGNSARVRRAGAGEAISLRNATSKNLRMTIQKVLQDSLYKQNALRLQDEIKMAGGVMKAADIIEKAISSLKPVVAR